MIALLALAACATTVFPPGTSYGCDTDVDLRADRLSLTFDDGETCFLETEARVEPPVGSTADWSVFADAEPIHLWSEVDFQASWDTGAVITHPNGSIVSTGDGYLDRVGGSIYLDCGEACGGWIEAPDISVNGVGLDLELCPTASLAFAENGEAVSGRVRVFLDSDAAVEIRLPPEANALQLEIVELRETTTTPFADSCFGRVVTTAL